MGTHPVWNWEGRQWFTSQLAEKFKTSTNTMLDRLRMTGAPTPPPRNAMGAALYQHGDMWLSLSEWAKVYHTTPLQIKERLRRFRDPSRPVPPSLKHQPLMKGKEPTPTPTPAPAPKAHPQAPTPMKVAPMSFNRSRNRCEPYQSYRRSSVV